MLSLGWKLFFPALVVSITVFDHAYLALNQNKITLG